MGREYRRAWPRSGAGAERLEVEVPLDRAQGLVVDGPVVAQVDHGLPLRGQDGVADVAMLEELELRLVARTAGGRPDVARLVVVLGLELLDELEVAGILAGQLVEPNERRLDRRQARVRLLILLDAAPSHPEPEPLDEPGQGQALADQRGHDDAEREEEDEVALREVRGEGQGGGQRHDAAHARPADDEDGLRRWRRVGLPDAGTEHPWDVRRRVDPDQAGDDHSEADR